MTAHNIVVVTVTYSPGKYLEQFFDSLTHAFRQDVTVVMVDNGSVDGSPEEAVHKYENAVLYETGENLGFGRGINYGVQKAVEIVSDAEYFVVANPDIQWTDGCLTTLVDAAQRWPRAGALGPAIEDQDGSLYPSARAIPTLWTGSLHAILVGLWPNNPWTRRYLQRTENPEERVAGWLSGACMLVRREAFEQVGGFDPRYFMYLEDVDLGDRLTGAGWENVYVPQARVFHAQGHSTKRQPARMLKAHHESAYRFFADRHAASWQAPLRLAVRGGLVLRAKLAIARHGSEK